MPKFIINAVYPSLLITHTSINGMKSYRGHLPCGNTEEIKVPIANTTRHAISMFLPDKVLKQSSTKSVHLPTTALLNTNSDHTNRCWGRGDICPGYIAPLGAILASKGGRYGGGRREGHPSFPHADRLFAKMGKAY